MVPNREPQIPKEYGTKLLQCSCKAQHLEVLGRESAVLMLAAHEAQVDRAAKLAVRCHGLQNRRNDLLRRELRAWQPALSGLPVVERRWHVGENLAAAALTGDSTDDNPLDGWREAVRHVRGWWTRERGVQQRGNAMLVVLEEGCFIIGINEPHSIS